MIRIGIVGCGRILAAHLRGYRLLREAGIGDFQITALCARNENDALGYVKRGEGPEQRRAVSDIEGDPLSIEDEYLSDFQKDIDVRIYTDYKRMIADGPIDAVNDFTTHGLHHLVAKETFSHGKHLMTQKPLAATIRAARQMCDQAEKSGVTFGVFENARNRPSTRYTKWAFDKGPCGDIQFLMNGNVGTFWAPDRIVAQTPWRHKLIEGGGISLDIGVHLFDMIRHIAGEIVAVSATTSVLEKTRYTRDPNGEVTASVECDADDLFIGTFETEAGATGSLITSWGGHGTSTVIGKGPVYYGSKGRVTGNKVNLDDGAEHSLENLYQDHCGKEQIERDFPHGLTSDFALAQNDWLEAIRHGQQPETDGREGLLDLACAYAMVESNLAKRTIEVTEVLSGDIREYQKPIDTHFGLE